MALAKISGKGWVVIPAEIRKKYGLKPGMQVQVVDYGGVISLVPLLKNPIRQAAGMLKGATSLSEALMDEHAGKWLMSPDARSIYVLDSFAILAFLNSESGMQRVDSVLHAVLRRQAHVCLSMINLGEVLYITERERGLILAQQVLSAIEQLPIEILAASRERVLSAAHIKAKYRLSYADAFAVAAAQEFDATVITGDPEFKRVETDGFIHIEWLPQE